MVTSAEVGARNGGFCIFTGTVPKRFGSTKVFCSCMSSCINDYTRGRGRKRNPGLNRGLNTRNSNPRSPAIRIPSDSFRPLGGSQLNLVPRAFLRRKALGTRLVATGSSLVSLT